MQNMGGFGLCSLLYSEGFPVVPNLAGPGFERSYEQKIDSKWLISFQQTRSPSPGGAAWILKDAVRGAIISQLKGDFEKPVPFELTGTREGWSFRTRSLAINISWFLTIYERENEYFTCKGEVDTTICCVAGTNPRSHVVHQRDLNDIDRKRHFQCRSAHFVLEKPERDYLHSRLRAEHAAGKRFWKTVSKSPWRKVLNVRSIAVIFYCPVSKNPRAGPFTKERRL